MAEWSKDHVTDIGSLKLKILVKRETGRAIRGKWRQLVRKVEEWVCGKPAPPRLYLLPVSVKDRWVGSREKVLNVPITCW
jgi:hypothetical protein